jgi:hypothetical protein
MVSERELPAYNYYREPETNCCPDCSNTNHVQRRSLVLSAALCRMCPQHEKHMPWPRIAGQPHRCNFCFRLRLHAAHLPSACQRPHQADTCWLLYAVLSP